MTHLARYALSALLLCLLVTVPLRGGTAAEIRRIMDGAGVTWQMAELGKAEKGGGGTISRFMARYGMDVLDFGTPLLNMHAPWELAAKADCFWTQRAYRAYFCD